MASDGMVKNKMCVFDQSTEHLPYNGCTSLDMGRVEIIVGVYFRRKTGTAENILVAAGRVLQSCNDAQEVEEMAFLDVLRLVATWHNICQLFNAWIGTHQDTSQCTKRSTC